MQQVNHQAEGRENIMDDDLLDAELRYCSTLPWIKDLLMEIQFLRGVHKEGDAPEVARLKEILDSIGANYDG